MNTQALIVSCVAITASTTFVREVKQGTGVEFRPYLGAAFMGIFLSLVGMASDQLARNFAILIILGVLLKDGGDVFTFASSVTKGNSHG